MRDLTWPLSRWGRFLMGVALALVAGLLAAGVLALLGQDPAVPEILFGALVSGVLHGALMTVALQGGENVWHPQRPR
ncbi:hypothetical protein [Arsenicicoccus dermatophilus]|uniref:hypothetical protein n=1 Tax=Arsenicicoccus dermatophilus TaxID=1076331 RepID=UPI001F4C6188|nr:hypothetical protein [Arsenicicoccus dermatophilus]MCH8614229.1 hypothetical protein [Arsenicicoccus dermatophilus]